MIKVYMASSHPRTQSAVSRLPRELSSGLMCQPAEAIAQHVTRLTLLVRCTCHPHLQSLRPGTAHTRC